jgi:hypothetical protein
MSARARKTTRSPTRPEGSGIPPSARKKERGGRRVQLTHVEVRRGTALRLRIAIADDALAEAGDELGTLIKKIAPSTRTAIIVPPPEVVEAPVSPEVIAGPEPEFIVSRRHEGDDTAYHENLRTHLTELITSLCDASLDDALTIAREERFRRAEGGN